MKNEKIILLVDIWIQVVLVSIFYWQPVLQTSVSSYLVLVIPFYQFMISANYHFSRKNIDKLIKKRRWLHIKFSWIIILIGVVTILIIQIDKLSSVFINDFALFLNLVFLFQLVLCIYYFVITIQDYKS